MKCHVCGTESPDSVNYCPTCGTPLMAVPAPAPQTPVPAPAPAPAPAPSPEPVDPYWARNPESVPSRYEQPVQERPAGGHFGQAQPTAVQPTAVQPAVEYPDPQPFEYAATRQYSQPMAPVQGYPMPGRQVETATLSKKPVWPIVLVVVLLLVIVALVVVLVSGILPGAQNGTASVEEGNVVVTTVEGEPVPQEQPAQQDGTAIVDDATPADPQSTAQDQAYASLVTAYDQFDGYNSRIVSVVDFFNTYYPSSADASLIQGQLAAAQALQGELAAQAATLNAIVLPEGSPLAQHLANMKTLNNDLVMRIGDLADALSAWLGGDIDSAGAALSRHNQNGVSIYKSEYDSLYPNARP